MSIRSKTLCGAPVAFQAVLAVLSVAAPSYAATVNFVTNGSFENFGTQTASFSINTDAALPNWTATPTGNQILDCAVKAGATTNLCGTTAFGGGLQFYAGFNPGSSPDGGNYVTIDADSAFETALTQTVTGLTVGKQYTLTFYQAAAQQSGFDFPSVNNQRPCLATGTSRCVDWQVTLGGVTQNSTNMILPNHQDVPWQQQIMTFTATASSEVLSFLAVADVAANSNLPPFALLDGVSLVLATPEPDSFALVFSGLIAVPFLRRWLKKRSR